MVMALLKAPNAQEISEMDSTMVNIPPLSRLIESALQHSPLLNAKTIDKKSAEQQIAIEKKKWMDHIYLDGAGNYGMFDQLVVSGYNTDGSANSGLLSRSEHVRYYAGVSVKLPVSSLTSRRKELNKSYFQLEQANFEILEIQKQIKQLIIKEYYLFIYYRESMENFFVILQTLQISSLKAEKDLLNGHIDLNEFAQISTMTGKAGEDYLKAKNNFYAQYHKLQNLTGIIF
jgi:outer membrane protein TolC